MHGTTVLPKEGITAGLSQNLAKKTVTAIEKWREGTEKLKHVNYRLNHLNQDPPAQKALLESIQRNEENKVFLEAAGNSYEGEYFNLEESHKEWLE